MIFLNFKFHTRGGILGRNPGKSLLPAIHSYLYSTVYSFALRFLFLKTHATSYLFLQLYSQDYAQKLKRNYTFVNSASALLGNIFLSASPWRSFPGRPVPGCKGRSGHPVPADKMSKGCSDTGMIHLPFIFTDQSGFDLCEITEGGVDSVEYCSSREPGTALLQSGDLIM
jgi:hypothetical protein